MSSHLDYRFIRLVYSMVVTPYTHTRVIDVRTKSFDNNGLSWVSIKQVDVMCYRPPRRVTQTAVGYLFCSYRNNWLRFKNVPPIRPIRLVIVFRRHRVVSWVYNIKTTFVYVHCLCRRNESRSVCEFDCWKQSVLKFKRNL